MSNNPNLRKILLFVGDIIIFYLSLLGTLFIWSPKNFGWKILSIHLFPFSLLLLIWLVIFYIFGFYDLSLLKTKVSFYARISIGLGIALITGVIFFYLFPFFGISPKTNLLLDTIFFGTLSVGWRKIFYSLSSSHFQNTTAIIGKNQQAKELARTIQENPHLGYKMLGFINPKTNILHQIEKDKIETIIIAENIEQNPNLAKNIYKCLSLRVNFIDLSRAYEIICEKIPISFVTQSWFLENIREKDKEITDKIKRLIDIVSAVLILVFTLPIWPLIMIAIKIEDNGPIFYLQKRIGKRKTPFLLIKFRSMRKDAEKKTGAVWAKKDDPRITKVGSFLRESHLDEIPQMINILKGDISLVGPRPERPEFITKLEKKIPYYHLRHLIKPGFTGWAQIKFSYARSISDSFEKFQYDLYYLKNRSITLDIQVLLKTLNILFPKR